MPIKRKLYEKSNKTKVNVNVFSEKNDTCTHIEDLFRPVRLFFWKVCHPVRLLKTVRLLETLEYPPYLFQRLS